MFLHSFGGLQTGKDIPDLFHQRHLGMNVLCLCEFDFHGFIPHCDPLDAALSVCAVMIV